MGDVPLNVVESSESPIDQFSLTQLKSIANDYDRLGLFDKSLISSNNELHEIFDYEIERTEDIVGGPVLKADRSGLHFDYPKTEE